MFVKSLPYDAIPVPETSDLVWQALSFMQDEQLRHLPVTEAGLFSGICSENILVNADANLPLKALEYSFLNISVKEDDHFLKAVALASTYDLTILPVTDKQNRLIGSLGAVRLLKSVAAFMSLESLQGILVLEVDSHQYSFTEISKIIETNDAQITQLNTSRDPDKGSILVTLCLNRLEISDIVASFQRYDYLVKYYSGEELYVNEIKENYENLMNYLNI